MCNFLASYWLIRTFYLNIFTRFVFMYVSFLLSAQWRYKRSYYVWQMKKTLHRESIVSSPKYLHKITLMLGVYKLLCAVVIMWCNVPYFECIIYILPYAFASHNQTTLAGRIIPTVKESINALTQNKHFLFQPLINFHS